MKAGFLWQISIIAAREIESRVVQLLEAVSGHPAVAVYQVEDARVTVSVYCEKPKAWLTAVRGELAAGLSLFEAAGLGMGPKELVIRKMSRREWAESWKRHFRPLEIGSVLLIKPSWSRRQPRPGEALVVIDPGLSFGTGQHPTTRFCLKQLAGWRRGHRGQSLLDIGTGSGILAIAAAKLGYRPVRAFDSDPVAVRIARENVRQNAVQHLISLNRQDLVKMAACGRPGFDVICANLEFDILMEQTVRILSRLRPGGLLILSGILTGQFECVNQAYRRAGMELVADEIAGEWHSGSYRRAFDVIER
ncbi:MAG: 50S ribosomal protein L11 methyltransferase [Candidatus Omnitrophica bacterium]|nr:50S ribosomal protein L11 methyltransferase [Candidatus Omnitrophota bacterium]